MPTWADNLLGLLIVAAVAYGMYKYIYLPNQERKKNRGSNSGGSSRDTQVK